MTDETTNAVDLDALDAALRRLDGVLANPPLAGRNLLAEDIGNQLIEAVPALIALVREQQRKLDKLSALDGEMALLSTYAAFVDASGLAGEFPAIIDAAAAREAEQAAQIAALTTENARLTEKAWMYDEANK